MNKAIILDRDGTINVEKNYLYKIEDFEYTFKADEAIKNLKHNGYLIVCITNQAGIARSYYKEEDVLKLHNWINEDLAKHNIVIDKFYYCPHHHEGVVEEYSYVCDCRKPNVTLYQRAIDELDIDINKSYVVGDKITDLIPGKKLGLKTVLVKTGYGELEHTKAEDKVDYFCENLYEASNLIINKNKGK